MVNGLIFEALQRPVLTDIKLRLFHRVVKFKRDEVNEHVLRHFLLARMRSRNKNTCNRWWWYGSFFAGLFRDLPEIATRDILSNVKALLGKEIVREIELEEIERRVVPLLPGYMVSEMKFFLGITNGYDRDKAEVDEFSDRLLENDAWKAVEDITIYLYKDGCSESMAVDEKLLKLCDRLVAFAETVY